MSKSTTAFEWQDLDEGQDLPPVPISESAPRGFGSGPERRLILGGAALFLAVALLTSSWAMRQTMSEQIQIHEELALAVEAEARPARREMVSTPEVREFTLTEESLKQVISVKVQALEHDMAAVLVVTEVDTVEDGPTIPYRQLRFYRHTAQGWQPTEPAPALWGQPQRLATEHFDFTYRSRDAQAVQAVAVELDALYEQTRRNFGLPPAPDRKTPISIVVGTAPGKRVQLGNELQNAHQEIIVSSPTLLLAPESLPDAAILRQSILLHLIDNTITEAASTHSLPPYWVPLLIPMRLWQIWDLGGPLAAPIPSYRSDVSPPYDDEIQAQVARFELEITASLLDYAAATYGRDRIGMLWSTLYEHENWATLIPAVFDVSSEEFIAGWHVYLAEIASIALE